MLHTPSDPSAGATLEADVCVVGAGPAGLTLAAELGRRGVAVVVLESGAVARDPAADRLGEGTVLGGWYGSLRTSRHRRVGGTAHLWNTRVEGQDGWARHLPLDPHDFAPGTPDGWPLGRAALDPFYRRAQAICGVEGGWDAADVSTPDRPRLEFAAGPLATGLYRFGDGAVWTRQYPVLLGDLPSVRLLASATALPLSLSASGDRVTAVPAAGASGCFTVVARIVVLACGAVETARLLLATGMPHRMAPWNEWDLVGRWFNEHVRDFGCAFPDAGPGAFEAARFYDAHRASDGTLVAGRLGPAAEVLDEGSPNFGVTLLPLGRPPVLAGVRRRLGLPVPGPPGYGWSARPFAPGRFAGFRVVLNLEHRPRAEHRITLGTNRDALGVPLPVLHYDWSTADEAGLARIRGLLSGALAGAGFGRMTCRPGARPDPNSHHHAGTARMHADPRYGVVDPDGRVHGTGNLFVVGGATFPRSGFANPVLTVVALACRLADHLLALTP